MLHFPKWLCTYIYVMVAILDLRPTNQISLNMFINVWDGDNLGFEIHINATYHIFSRALTTYFVSQKWEIKVCLVKSSFGQQPAKDLHVCQSEWLTTSQFREVCCKSKISHILICSHHYSSTHVFLCKMKNKKTIHLQNS